MGEAIDAPEQDYRMSETALKGWIATDQKKQATIDALVAALEAMIAWANGKGSNGGYPGTQAAAAIRQSKEPVE